MKILTQKTLKEKIFYNKYNGLIYSRSKVDSKGRKKRLGTYDLYGYRTFTIKGRQYKIHRLAWLYVYGYLPENEIDHINRIKDDNRIKNLREVSRSCNTRNRDIQPNNTSGVTGVSFYARDSNWQSCIKINRKTIFLGRYKEFKDAVFARWCAENKYGWPNCNCSTSAFLYLKENNYI